MSDRYIVYLNFPKGRSVGHLESCPYPRRWGSKITRSSGWLGPYDSREYAKLIGEKSGNPFHWCGRCIENSK